MKDGSFAHVLLHVRTVAASAAFYDRILGELGWRRTVDDPEWAGWTNGEEGFFVVVVGDAHRDAGYHRKRIGLNHIAFHAESREAVDTFAQFLDREGIPVLYGGPKEYPEYRAGYYAVYVEDPDRIKVEVAYIPSRAS